MSSHNIAPASDSAASETDGFDTVKSTRMRSSAGEHGVHIAGVVGSIPTASTTALIEWSLELYGPDDKLVAKTDVPEAIARELFKVSQFGCAFDEAGEILITEDLFLGARAARATRPDTTPSGATVDTKESAANCSRG